MMEGVGGQLNIVLGAGLSLGGSVCYSLCVISVVSTASCPCESPVFALSVLLAAHLSLDTALTPRLVRPDFETPGSLFLPKIFN